MVEIVVGSLASMVDCVCLSLGVYCEDDSRLFVNLCKAATFVSLIVRLCGSG